MSAVDYLLKEYAGLELLEEPDGRYRLTPLETWKDAADKVAAVISGYGTFEYADGKALKDGGPYDTYAQAVITHLHWLKKGPEVYGGRSYDRFMR